MKKLIFLLMAIALIPALSLANGGDQRVVDGKYIINLSRAPFTPRVGVKISMLASFADITKKKLIVEDLIVRVRIAELGGGKREFLFEEDNLIVKGGVLELDYTFTKTGLHEIFFDFAFASNPEIIYEAPDFLLDVQKAESPAPTPTPKPWPIITVTGVVGMIIGFLLSRIKLSKNS